MHTSTHPGAAERSPASERSACETVGTNADIAIAIHAIQAASRWVEQESMRRIIGTLQGTTAAPPRAAFGADPTGSASRKRTPPAMFIALIVPPILAM